MKINRLANNQQVIIINNLEIFHSYESVISVYIKNTDMLIFGRNWNFSITTKKYLKRFLEETCPLIFEKIMSQKGKTFADKVKKSFEKGYILFQDDLINDASSITDCRVLQS